MLTLIKLAAALFTTLLIQFIPLVGAYHYESALSIALIGIVFVPIIAPRRQENVDFHIGRLFAVSLLFWLLANGLAMGAAWIRNDLCDIKAGLIYQCLISLPALLLSTAVWSWATTLSRFSFIRVLAYFLFVAADFGFALYGLYHWPALVSFGHFFGYFAGSIYDEAIDITHALIFFRIGTCVLLLCFLIAQRQGFQLWKRIVWACIAILFAAGYHIGLAALEIIPPMGREALEKTLWRTVKAQDGAWIVHYMPQTRDSAERRFHEDRISAEYARDFARLERFFNTRPSAPIDIWLYPTYETKARFLAARHTSFARVWKHEIHLVEASPRVTTPRHEMAHLFAESFGNRPLGVAGAWGIPAMGWVEGLAMAAEWPYQSYDLHTWSAAILSHPQTFPQPSPLGMIYGFWSLPSRVAYTLAGSYVRWLIDTYGIENVKRLSRVSPGHFEDIIPASFHDTFEAWKRFLSQKQDVGANERVELVFGSRSIWTKKCARYTAAQNQLFSRCLNDATCTDEVLQTCASDSDPSLPPERDWMLYLASGALSDTTIDNTAADFRKSICHKLDGLDVETFSPLERLIWDERRADMLWHAGFYLPAAFAYHALLSRPLPKSMQRRLEIKRQAAFHPTSSVSKDVRRWFTATSEETRMILYARNDDAPVMAWLELINALSDRRYARAIHATEQIWMHYGNSDPASALPPSALDDLIHIMSHIYTH